MRSCSASTLTKSRSSHRRLADIASNLPSSVRRIFSRFTPPSRRVIGGPAAILRVADALDRSHFGVVKNIEVRCSPGRLIVEVDSKREQADLELWTCQRRTDLLSRLLDRRVVLQRQSCLPLYLPPTATLFHPLPGLSLRPGPRPRPCSKRRIPIADD